MGSLTEKLSSSVWRVCGKSVAKVASIVMLRNFDEPCVVFSLLFLGAVFNCSWFELRKTVQFGFVNYCCAEISEKKKGSLNADSEF